MIDMRPVCTTLNVNTIYTIYTMRNEGSMIDMRPVCTTLNVNTIYTIYTMIDKPTPARQAAVHRLGLWWRQHLVHRAVRSRLVIIISEQLHSDR